MNPPLTPLHHPGCGTRAALAALLVLTGGAAAALEPRPAPLDSAERRAHDAHHATIAVEPIKRSLVDYRIPDVRLVRDDGQSVSLPQELGDARPVFVDFIYTTCTAICPVTSATFAALQDKLGPDREKVRMMSVSIDPEEDTPRRLAQYRERYGAGRQWHHYTGTVEASIATQRAFGVFTGDKMGHTPVTLFRAAPGAQWVRLDGFATPDELLREYHASPTQK